MAAIDYTVPGIVPAIQQPTDNTCWATAATILYSWKNNASSDIGTVISTTTPDFLAMFQADQGLPGTQKPAFLTALGLNVEPPQDYSVDGWGQLLENYGALWITTVVGPSDNFSVHARILKAISGDGEPDTTMMSIVDPGSGSEYTESITNFTQQFDDLARADMQDGGDFRPQVVHY